MMDDVARRSRMLPYSSMEALSPVKYIEKKVNSPSPMLNFLYGLAMGRCEVDKDTIKRPYLEDTAGQSSTDKTMGLKIQSQFFAIAGATDMLLRSTTGSLPHGPSWRENCSGMSINL